MADTHPYISGAANMVQAVNHLRNSFPATVNADTFKKLGITFKEKTAKNVVIKKTSKQGGNTKNGSGDRNIGLTVRVEINLPADGDQKTND